MHVQAQGINRLSLAAAVAAVRVRMSEKVALQGAIESLSLDPEAEH